MQKKFLILIAVITVLISCHKNSSTPTTEALEGTWKYIGHSGGYPAVNFTPENTETYIQFHGTNYLENIKGHQICGSFRFTKDTITYYRFGFITFDTNWLSSFSDNKYDFNLFHDTLRLYPHETADAPETYYIPSSKQFNSCATSQP